jgi:hypothetical protein
MPPDAAFGFLFVFFLFTLFDRMIMWQEFHFLLYTCSRLFLNPQYI